MAGRRVHIERDNRGRERFVLMRSPSHHRAGSQDRRTTRELLRDAEEREQVLIAEVQSLQTRLSIAQRNEWAFQNLREEHHRCGNLRAELEAQIRKVRKLEALLLNEEDKNERLLSKNEKLEEKLRLMKRGSREVEYKSRYEEKLLEVEVLRQRLAERDEMVRLAETRIADKNRTIIYLKNFLREHGFRVRD